MDIKIVTSNYLQITKPKADKRWVSVFWNRVCLLKYQKSSPRMGVYHCHWTWYAQCYPTQTAQQPGTSMPDTPPHTTITSTPPPGQSLQFRTYNSRRLSVWKSCQESVVSRLLDKFLQKWTNKGVVKGQSQQQECPPWRTQSPGGRRWCTSFSSPSFAKDKPAMSWGRWAAVKGMLKPFSRVRFHTSKKQYGSLASSSRCPLIKPQGACWKQPSLNNSPGGDQAHSILDIHTGRESSGSFKLLTHPSPRTHAHFRDQDISLLFTHLFS